MKASLNSPTDSAHLHSINQVAEKYGVQVSQGLSDAEVTQRLKEYGANRLETHKRKTIFQMFFGQLQDALIYVLLSAVVITFIMGEYVDGIIISAVICINAILGVFQEIKAGNSIEALRNLATPKALVKRNGAVKEINSEEVVPGDIIVLDAGRYIPADLRLVESANLQIDESALTGESVASEKNASSEFSEEYIPLGDRTNLAYMSTLVTYGRGLGVVINTGSTTEVGKIASYLTAEDTVETPLEKRLSQLGKTLGKAAVIICLVMFAISYFQGRDISEMFLTAVSLAVASIPEGLAAIVAIVLSVGVTKMAKKNAIIKKLPAVETLGSVNVICSDKTGTLTQNVMTVQEIFTFSSGIRKVDGLEEPSDEEKLLSSAMVLASDATLEKNGDSTGDPTEIALLYLADNLGIDRANCAKEHPRVDELAFDSDRKMMSTLHQHQDSYSVYAKGAVDNLILKCNYVAEYDAMIPLTDTHRHLVSEAVEKMSDSALRTLAVAYKVSSKKISQEDFEDDLVLIGVVGMIDPPRDEVKHSIQQAKDAGITTIMITGDHKNTAVAIAKELGIASDLKEATTGADINRMSQEELVDHIDDFKVFARVSPEHKVNIVKAFKSKGNVVSMTGDGVNDAPSLNAADIGVAMGITGTDVAKNASDMILADDNFATIVNAIEQGRNIYNNIKKSVVFLLASNVGEVIAMFLAVLVGMPVPLLATQLLWINLITDSLPAIALGMDSGNPDVMQEKPRSANENFFSHGAGKKIIIVGTLIGLLTIFAFWLGYRRMGLSPFAAQIPEEIHAYARTMAFLTIIACQMIFSLSFKHDTLSLFQTGLFKNKYLIGAIVLGFGLQLLVIYIPFMQESFKLQAVGLEEWAIILGLGAVPWVYSELDKWFIRSRMSI
jgi:Ca2+-transporting ATPase